jgi:hypothetical protein
MSLRLTLFLSSDKSAATGSVRISGAWSIGTEVRSIVVIDKREREVLSGEEEDLNRDSFAELEGDADRARGVYGDITDSDTD